jgi:hypothetical protein
MYFTLVKEDESCYIIAIYVPVTRIKHYQRNVMISYGYNVSFPVSKGTAVAGAKKFAAALHIYATHSRILHGLAGDQSMLRF